MIPTKKKKKKTNYTVPFHVMGNPVKKRYSSFLLYFFFFFVFSKVVGSSVSALVEVRLSREHIRSNILSFVCLCMRIVFCLKPSVRERLFSFYFFYFLLSRCRKTNIILYLFIFSM